MEKSLHKALLEYDFRQPAALCSQLEWKGSVPRKDFPLMLVLADGNTIGTIGGGNMEYAVIELAKKVLQSRQPVFQEFDLNYSKAMAPGSICGGYTKILVEPFTPEIQSFLRSLHSPEPTGQSIIVTCVERGEPLRSDRFRVEPGTGKHSLPERVLAAIRKARDRRKAVSVDLDSAFYLVQPLAPPPVLHLFGAGHIGKAVAELAHFIDLEVIVYDDRRELSSPERFPEATLFPTESFDRIIDEAPIAPQDFVLIATRGHQHDLVLLRDLLKKEVAYIGLMSSRRKWQILSEALLAEEFPPKSIRKVHAPVGLDIHSKTVPEIAVSIISEIIGEYRSER